MPNALILGASGMTGRELCTLLLNSSSYETVKILVRHPVDLVHPRLVQQLYDYDNPDPAVFTSDHVFCCLGTTMRKAGSRERFSRIDREYVTESARLAKANGASHFSLMSAVGADKNSRIFYNRVKGQVEEDLMSIGIPSLAIFRPSLLLGNRQEFRLGEKLGMYVMKASAFLTPKSYRAVRSSQVAQAMYRTAQENYEGVKVLSNAEIISIDA